MKLQFSHYCSTKICSTLYFLRDYINLAANNLPTYSKILITGKLNCLLDNCQRARF